VEHDSLTDERTGSLWQPLTAIERRVLGVLIEKAKTTPENYPLSLNAIRVGSNQKSNRAPQMQLEEGDALEALDSLREKGAVAVIQGDGRVEKFRHLAYDWLGVEKIELSIMAELLLRGDQTIGELRGRAARMDPIADLAALRPLLASLLEKGLIVYLTPEGRGCTVTHHLYLPQQLDKLRAKYGTPSDTGGPDSIGPASAGAATAERGTPAPGSTSPQTAQETNSPQESDLHRQVTALRAEVAELKQQLAELTARVDKNSNA